SWLVNDADDYFVGRRRGSLLQDGFGRHVATLEPRGSDCGGRFVGLDRAELGTWTEAPAGTTVTFARAVEGHPFAKMLLLAAVLSTKLPPAGEAQRTRREGDKERR